eukprot:TRINITY_DN42367_c0_g1_i1.p1 TRINITY_DN42367_c0_g1~~TRINITY_DN42367_c0_g1_i1.p1  ORF type:complete len:392 (-),score=100.84 TRINITY_DN42367_c0_g1_i1:234-1409(-)
MAGHKPCGGGYFGFSGHMPSLERLDTQVASLGNQILEAVRALTRVQELVQQLDRRVVAVEDQQKSQGHWWSEAAARGGALAQYRSSNGHVPGRGAAGQELLCASNERIEAKLRDLQQRQAEVADAVFDLVAEARRADKHHGEDSTAPLASPSSDRAAAAWKGPSSPPPRWLGESGGGLQHRGLASREGNLPSYRQGGCHEESAWRTDATIGQLESDLARLRQDLAEGAPPAGAAPAPQKSLGAHLPWAHDAKGRGGEPVPSEGWGLSSRDRADWRAPAMSELYEELVRLEEEGKRWREDATANAGLQPSPIISKPKELLQEKFKQHLAMSSPRRHRSTSPQRPGALQAQAGHGQAAARRRAASAVGHAARAAEQPSPAMAGTRRRFAARGS